MAKLKGTILASPIVPSDSLDTYATHSAEYGKGGHKSVNNVSDLNLISLARREEGMTVYVIAEETEYRLKGGIANENWIKDNFSRLESIKNYETKFPKEFIDNFKFPTKLPVNSIGFSNDLDENVIAFDL